MNKKAINYRYGKEEKKNNLTLGLIATCFTIYYCFARRPISATTGTRDNTRASRSHTNTVFRQTSGQSSRDYGRGRRIGRSRRHSDTYYIRRWPKPNYFLPMHCAAAATAETARLMRYHAAKWYACHMTCCYSRKQPSILHIKPTPACKSLYEKGVVSNRNVMKQKLHILWHRQPRVLRNRNMTWP